MAKKEKIPVVSCTECEYAALHQWMKNPIIAICSAKKGERFVASCKMACNKFKHSNSRHDIIHHESY